MMLFAVSNSKLRSIPGLVHPLNGTQQIQTLQITLYKDALIPFLTDTSRQTA